MVTSLKKLMGSFFSHHNGVEFSFSDNEKPEGPYLSSRLMTGFNNTSSSVNGENVSIQKQKQMFARNMVNDSTRNHYIENFINYDTLEFEKVSTMIKIDEFLENDFLNNLKKCGFNYNKKTTLNFHCIYCHLLKVIVYHPVKTKIGHTSKLLSAENQYAKEYDYLSSKIGKVINHALKNKQYPGLTQEDNISSPTEKPGFFVNKKITLAKLNSFINSVEVNTAELYSYLHSFQKTTGNDNTLEKYYKDLARKLNNSEDEDLDIVQLMLSWVIEDCTALFLTSNEEDDSDSELEDEDESFSFDCQKFRSELEKDVSKKHSDLSAGQQTWFARRQEQYAYYEQIDSHVKESVLKENNIRPISYLKIYELLMSGIGLKNSNKRLSLDDFMTICFVGWIHDGKWEDGIRA